MGGAGYRQQLTMNIEWRRRCAIQAIVPEYIVYVVYVFMSLTTGANVKKRADRRPALPDIILIRFNEQPKSSALHFRSRR